MENIEYLDYGGNPVSLSQFQQMFGPFHILRPPLSMYRVTCMYAAVGSNTFRLRVVDEDDNPIAGITTVFGWPDGQATGITDGDGYSEFAMGGGAWYEPAETAGPHHISLVAGGPSDVLHGIGMVLGTWYNHFNAVMRYGSVEPPDLVVVELLEAQEHIQNALDLLQVG